MTKGVAVDSNLLLLLIVGSADRRWISSHKRLSAFTDYDFDLLKRLVDAVEKIIVLPHILAEVSNLIDFRQRDEKNRRIQNVFKKLTEDQEELYIESTVATRRREFLWLGLTDSALLSLLETDTDITLLTMDSLLADAAARAKFNVTNFNYYRKSI